MGKKVKHKKKKRKTRRKAKSIADLGRGIYG